MDRGILHALFIILWASVAPASAAAHAPASAPPNGLRIADSCAWPRGLDGAVRRFSRALQFRTVSDADAETHARDPGEFEALLAHLEAAYAGAFSRLEVERVGAGGLSRLLTWRGRDASLRPALFVSHIDVVPVPEASVSDWTHPPFSGAVADGFVWGRGALDVKVRARVCVRACPCVRARVVRGRGPANSLFQSRTPRTRAPTARARKTNES